VLHCAGDFFVRKTIADFDHGLQKDARFLTMGDWLNASLPFV